MSARMFVSMIEMINRNQKSNTNEIKKKTDHSPASHFDFHQIWFQLIVIRKFLKKRESTERNDVHVEKVKC